MTLPPDALKACMVEHARRTNAKTAIKVANVSAEELEEWKEKAAGRDRKNRAKMKGATREELKAKNQKRTRKRRANAVYDTDEEDKEKYNIHRRDAYARKEEAMTADELKAFNTENAAKSKAQREKKKEAK